MRVPRRGARSARGARPDTGVPPPARGSTSRGPGIGKRIRGHPGSTSAAGATTGDAPGSSEGGQAFGDFSRMRDYIAGYYDEGPQPLEYDAYPLASQAIPPSFTPPNTFWVSFFFLFD